MYIDLVKHTRGKSCLKEGVYMGKIRDERAGEMVVLGVRAAELPDLLTPEMRYPQPADNTLKLRGAILRPC